MTMRLYLLLCKHDLGKLTFGTQVCQQAVLEQTWMERADRYSTSSWANVHLQHFFIQKCPFGTQLRTIGNQKQLRKHHVRHCVLCHRPPQREVPVLRHFLVPAVCCAAALQITCYIALQAIARSCLQPRGVVQKRVLRPLQLSRFEALSVHILNVCPLPTVSACETLLMLLILNNGKRMPGPWELLFI